MVCDQPFAGKQLLVLAETTKASAYGIVASGYSGTFGVPMVFEKRYFEQLSGLTGNEGAKKIAVANPDDLLIVPFPEGSIDIDTEQDYLSFTEN